MNAATRTSWSGNVTGPHLHYHVTSTGDTEEAALGNTILVRVEVTPIYAPGRWSRYLRSALMQQI